MRERPFLRPRTKALVVAGLAAACGVVAGVVAHYQVDTLHRAGFAAVCVLLIYGAGSLSHAVLTAPRGRS
ncbi:hypothetical protein VZQ01_06680 [Myxococcus faecalis]|uniref:hypothetical protein n=1 Tax=Myxococcus faecalis TaxID=3115646 RepID=UPI003CE9EB35